MSIVNDKITVSIRDGVTYGVSIADLRTAFHSARVDLLAIICEDATPSTVTTADASDDFSKSGAETFRSAFALGALREDGSRLTPVPIPSGYSFVTKTRSKSYEKGDLIMGRNPRWQLWADGVNVGKTVLSSTGVSGEITRNNYRYNIFNAPNRSDGLPNLEEWQGYPTQSSDSHEPRFAIENAGNIEFHNGVMTKCDLSTANYPTQLHRGGIVYPDWSVYVLNRSLGGRVMFAIGNLIDWWQSESVPFRRDAGLRRFKDTGEYYDTMDIYGGGLVLSLKAYTGGTSQSDVSIAAIYESGMTALGYGATQPAIWKWRDGLTVQQDTLWRNLYARGEFEAYLFSYVIAKGSGTQIPLNGEVVLVNAVNRAETSEIDEPYIVHTNDVLGYKSANVNGVIPSPRDTNIYSRLILKSDKTGNNTIVTARRGDSSGSYPIFQSNNGRQYIVFPFYRVNSDGQVVTTSGLSSLYVIVQTFSTDSNGKISAIDRRVVLANLWQNIQYGATTPDDMFAGIARSYLPNTTTMYKDTQWADPEHNVYVLCVEGGNPSEIAGLANGDIMNHTTAVVDIHETRPTTITFYGRLRDGSESGTRFDVYNNANKYLSVGTMKPYIETQIGSIDGRIMFSNTEWTPVSEDADLYSTRLTFWKNNETSNNYERLTSDYSSKLVVKYRIEGSSSQSWGQIDYSLVPYTETIVTPARANDGTMIMETSAITYELTLHLTSSMLHKSIQILVYVNA